MITVVYVSPHSIGRFQTRIAKLPHKEALTTIYNALVGLPLPGLYDPQCYFNINTGQYKFCALVAGPHEEGKLPIVVTILPYRARA